MRRALLLSVSAVLLGLLAGCCRNRCQGRCDCQVYPLEHGTPSPIVKPGAVVVPLIQPVAPVPAQ